MACAENAGGRAYNGGKEAAMVFEADGIRFQYPENWSLTREEADSGWTVSVQSPETAFFLIAFDKTMPELGAVVETVLHALKADYPDLEAEDALESVAKQPALGHNITFFSLDLTNTCCTRSFYSEMGTILLMWQANDLELERVDPIFRAIRASLRIEE
jgi:hypothetical protein